MDCNICCENINKSVRKPVNCPACDEVCCLKCFKTVLLSNHNPSCMFCKKDFSHLFIASVVPVSFYEKDYMRHRAKDELSKEKSLLPLAQIKVPLFKRIKETEEKRKELSIRYASVMSEIKNIKPQIKKDCANFSLVDRYMVLKKMRRDVLDEIRNVKEEERYMLCMGNSQPEAKEFCQSCPIGGCRGFLSTAWKCGTCEKYICSKCHEVKKCRDDEEHKCDPSIVKSILSIKKECKPCPGCHKPIYKIDGCDLMWCVSCHTKFSWNKGRIVKGNNHNPHYYEWLREKNNGVIPRNEGDNPCGGCGQMPWIEVLETLMIETGNMMEKIERCYRLVGELKTTQLLETTINEEKRLEDRVKYLMKDLSEEYWLKKLTSQIKNEEYIEEYNNILRLASSGIEDIFINFSKGAVDNIEVQMHTFRKYVNLQFIKLKYRYKKKTVMITKNWDVERC